MAAIDYNIWRLDHTRDSYRQRAAALYGALYQRTPVWEYRKPYEDLTGERLPEPLPLPSLPAEMLHDLPDLETLLARTERRLGG